MSESRPTGCAAGKDTTEKAIVGYPMGGMVEKRVGP